MKAVRMHRQGGPEVLTYEEVPRPEPGPGDVLIEVRAACLNPPDWYFRSGFGTIPPELRPKVPLPYTFGSDLSGVVVATGPGVTRWRPGDEVFGLVRFPSAGNVGNGGKAYAQFATSPESHLARKPADLDHVQAAAVPMAGLTAYQYVHDLIRLERGRTVLVNGAAGGVGHFAVQLAKLRDAHVIAVASGRHGDFLRGLGADEVLDYETTAAEDVVRGADVVIDCVGGPHGYRFLSTVRRPGGLICPVFHGEFHRERGAGFGIEFRSTQVHSDGEQLAELAGLLADGRLRVQIDSTFPLADAAKAHERAGRGHIQGKIVLTVP